MRRIIVILPAYNEARALPALLKKFKAVKETLSEGVILVMVDDGSRDATADIIREAAREMEVITVTHERNRGLRQSFQDGFEAAVRAAADDDVIVTMDADDTQDPKYIEPMLSKLDEGYDVVIASRYRGGARVRGVPCYRRLFSLGANLLCRLFLHIKGVRDYACGFRAFRARLLKDCVAHYGDDFLEIRGFGFICAVETITKASARGGRFTEIPFELRYDRREGGSKMRVGRTIMGYFVLLWKSRRIRRAAQG